LNRSWYIDFPGNFLLREGGGWIPGYNLCLRLSFLIKILGLRSKATPAQSPHRTASDDVYVSPSLWDKKGRFEDARNATTGDAIEG